MRHRASALCSSPSRSGIASLLLGISLAGVLQGALPLGGCTMRDPAPLTSTPRVGDFEQAEQLAARSGKLLVVDFGAPWCGPCKRMEREVWSDPEVRSWIGRHAVRVHVETEQRGDLVRRLEVGALPTTIVFRNGREVGRHVGPMSARSMLQWLGQM